MSEEVQAEVMSEPASQEAPAEKQPTAGELLRQAREAAGLHVAALAVSMKVPVKKLEALESDRLDLLPDAVFVRALASSVCRTLKMDPTPVLALLPQTTAPQLKPDEWGINAPFRAPGDVATASMWSQLSRPGVLAALALLVAALVLILFPSMEREEGAGGSASEVVVALPTPATVAPQPDAAAKPAETPMEKPVEVKTPVPQPVAAAPAPVAAPLALPSAQVTPPVVPVAPAAAAVQPVTASGSGVLAFKARGPSWVEVTDAQGVVQLRRTLVTGETVGVSGALPLSVVVGRADVTDVLVRGKPFSLDTVARENVARFEVK